MLPLAPLHQHICSSDLPIPVQDLFKDLVAWWKEVLGAEVTGVKVSTRLATSPAIVVTSQYGWSANMERIMRAQAMGDSGERNFMKGIKTLEINPRHPLIQELRTKVCACWGGR